MANRVTSADVQEIIDYDDNISLDVFITAANLLVTEVCTSSGYSVATLKEIERWLSGHCYLLRDQAVKNEKAGSVAISYQFQIGLFLQQTKQGQMAMLLDSAGNLAQLSKRMEQGESAAVTIDWLGKNYDTADPDD